MGRLERTGRHYRLARAEDTIIGPGLEALRRQDQGGDPGVEPDRQVELRCIGVEVAGDLLFSRVGVRRSGKRHAGEGSVLGGGEQGEGVPARAPGVPGFGARLQHYEPQVLTGQVPGHGQAGLAAADHDHVQELILSHGRKPPSTVRR